MVWNIYNICIVCLSHSFKRIFLSFSLCQFQSLFRCTIAVAAADPVFIYLSLSLKPIVGIIIIWYISVGILLFCYSFGKIDGNSFDCRYYLMVLLKNVCARTRTYKHVHSRAETPNRTELEHARHPSSSLKAQDQGRFEPALPTFLHWQCEVMRWRMTTVCSKSIAPFVIQHIA